VARGPEAGLPALARPAVQAIAPSPQQPVARRAPTAPFGEIDLPLVSQEEGRPADLPSAVAPGLPVSASPGFASATGVGLPSPTGVGLPSAVAVGLPSAAGVGLPTAVGGVGMPMPATSVGMPSPATAVGMPSPATALGMPETAMASGVPMSAGGSGLPAAVGAGLPMSAELGVELYGGHPAGGDLDIGDEISLGSGYPPAGPTGGGRGGAGGMGDGIELATDAAVVSQRQQTARAPIVEIAPARRRPVRRYVLAFVVLAAVGGGSLALLPDIGPFGFNKATDVLNAPKHAAALVEIRRDAQQELEADTAAAAARALARARAAQESSPRHRPTAAYAAYLALASNVRFGKKPQDDAYAKEMVAKAEGQPAPGPEAMLAAAALDTSGGQLARARQALGNLSTIVPGDIDAAVLAGELELIAKAPDNAVPAWKQAVSIKKSARTLFGLARAQLAAGEIAGAEESAKAVLAASPLHAGARTLLAQIAWPKPEREAEAVELVTKVTSEGEVRAASSPGELVEAYTVLGRIHLARSRISAAEQAFGAALKLDPQAVQALLGNGELFYGSGRYSEALARFEAAIAADADSVAAVVGRGKTLLALERMKEAKDLLFALRQKKPKEPAIAYWLGRTEEALGNKKAAEAAYLDTVKIGGDRPEIVDAYVALSNLLSSIGRGDDAAAKLTEASKQFPDSPALHRAKGEVALAAGRYDEAKKELEAALATEDNLATRFKLGQVYRRMRQFDAAVTVFDGITAVDKEFPGLALERGILFEETGQTEKALDMYNSALQKAPNDIDLLLRVGSTMVMAGQVKEAEPILRKVVTQRPTAEGYHFLGRALLLKGSNLTEAMRYLERGVEGDPNRAEYWLYVGWAANETGNPSRAEETLKKALELDQNNGDAYWQRAVLRQKQSACLDALDDVKKALEKRPSRYEAYSTMARCLSEQSRWGETIEAWKKAIAGNDKVPEWHYRLGKVYESSGNRGAAHAELRRALELLDPAVEKQTSWAADAHRLAGESWQVSNPEQAEKHFRRYLELAPSEDAGYRREIERWLEQRRGAN
jgi:tetratricopeptide (TPR) repeat protein